jgi:threonine dehydrogenase-like Zn-dependent dehydrogenase
VTIEQNFTIPVPDELGDLGVLTEPASILAKAWDHVERIGCRSKSWRPRSLLVTGAGPIGLLAALMGAERKLDVHVFDRHWSGRKPQLIEALRGKGYRDLDGALEQSRPDVVMECTGEEAVIAALLGRTAPGGIICLLGVSPPGRKVDADIGAINRTTVLDNDVVFGSVNANRDHYQRAVRALIDADRDWLTALITRRVPLDGWSDALEHREGDIKTIIEFSPL